MPTVPTYNGAGVAPSSAPGGNFATPQAGNAQPQQLQQLGEATQRAGQQLGGLAMDMQQQVNQVRVDDALNKARQQMQTLTYDTQSGYRNLTGDAALTRPNGKMLADEYGEKLQTSITELSSGLGNDMQRTAFMQQANNLMTQFRGGIEQHTLEEYRKFSLSTQDGTIKLGADEAKRNWNNPDMIKSSLESVQAAVYRRSSLEGLSASETQARIQQITSGVHTNVIDAALQENNPEYALGYLDKYKNEMTADDLLRVRGVVNKDVYQRLADGIATNVVTGARTQAAPSDLGRMAAITASSESGSRERDAAGNLITSPKGAQGAMQVMPSTRVAPGFGVTPAKDDSDAERTRVGRDYLQAMVKNYAGDPAKAWGAYNWGPGNVDAAIRAHGADWLNHAPQETRDYVAKNMAALGAGGGISKPTLQDVHDQVRAQITAKFGTTPPAGVLKLALASASQQFEDLQKATKAAEEQHVTTAMQGLLQNGGRFSALPYAVRSQIPADKVDNVLSFAQRVAKGDDITNPAVYQRLSDPAALRRLSDNQFFQLRSELSESDFKHFSAQRAAALDKDTDKIGTLNMSALNTVLKDKLRTFNMDPSPKDGSSEAAQLGVINKFLQDGMAARQKVTGKQMTDVEVGAFVDEQFAKSNTFRTSWLGINTGGGTERLLLTTKIPDDTREALIADFKKAGIDKPNDSDLLGAYLRLKSAPQRTAGTTRNPFVKGQ